MSSRRGTRPRSGASARPAPARPARTGCGPPGSRRSRLRRRRRLAGLFAGRTAQGVPFRRPAGHAADLGGDACARGGRRVLFGGMRTIALLMRYSGRSRPPRRSPGSVSMEDIFRPPRAPQRAHHGALTTRRGTARTGTASCGSCARPTGGGPPRGTPPMNNAERRGHAARPVVQRSSHRGLPS